MVAIGVIKIKTYCAFGCLRKSVVGVLTSTVSCCVAMFFGREVRWVWPALVKRLSDKNVRLGWSVKRFVNICVSGRAGTPDEL